MPIACSRITYSTSWPTRASRTRNVRVGRVCLLAPEGRASRSRLARPFLFPRNDQNRPQPKERERERVIMSARPNPETLEQIKTMLRRDLKLGPDVDIADDKPFFGGEV